MTSTRHQPQTNLPDNKQFQITKNALLDPVSSVSLEIFGGNINLPAPQLVPLLYSGGTLPGVGPSLPADVSFSSVAKLKETDPTREQKGNENWSTGGISLA